MKRATIKIIRGRRKDRATDALEIYAYLVTKQKYYINTGYAVRSDQWLPDEGKVINHPEASQINLQLEFMIQKIRMAETEFVLQNKIFALNNLKDLFEGGNTSHFSSFCSQRLMESSITPESARAQRQFITFLDKNWPNLNVQDIDYSFIVQFDSRLREKYSANTVKRFHKDMRKFLNLAINYKLFKMDDDPYRRFKVPAWKNKHEFLFRHEVDKLLNLDLSNFDHFRLYRDAFVFSCFTGLRFSDLKALSVNNFQIRDAKLFLHVKENEKTGSEIFLRLSEMFDALPAQIIQPYIDRAAGKSIWPRTLINSHFNGQLKVLQEMAGIQTKLTIHLARHTFGTLYAKEIGSIFEVMRAMSIKSYKTAQVYINLSGMI